MTKSRFLGAWFAFVYFGFYFQLSMVELFIDSGSVYSYAYRAIVLSGSICVPFYSLLRGQYLTTHRVMNFITIFCLFITLYFFSIFRSLISDSGSLAFAPEYYILMFLGVSMIPAVSIIFSRKIDGVRFMVVSVFLLFFTCVFVLIIYSNSLLTGNTEVIRLSSEKMNPISLGHAGVSLAILVLVLRDHANKMIVMYPLVVFGMATALLSFSRGAVISGVVVLLIYYFRKLSARRLAAFLFLCMCSLAIFYSMSDILFSELYPAHNPLLPYQVLGSDDDMSVNMRKQSFIGGIEQFMDHPIVGDHIEERSSGFYPHNILIESLMSMGIIGGLLIVVIISLSLRSAFVCLKKQDFSVAVALLYIQHLVGAMVSGSIFSNNMFWYMSVFVIVVAYSGNVQKVQIKYPVRLPENMKGHNV